MTWFYAVVVTVIVLATFKFVQISRKAEAERAKQEFDANWSKEGYHIIAWLSRHGYEFWRKNNDRVVVHPKTRDRLFNSNDFKGIPIADFYETVLALREKGEEDRKELLKNLSDDTLVLSDDLQLMATYREKWK